MIEGFFNLSTKGHFIKPNFLLLPLKPMYGIAATLLILIKDKKLFKIRLKDYWLFACGGIFSIVLFKEH